MPHSLFELNAMTEQQLRSLAEELKIKNYKKLDIEHLGYAILDEEASRESQKTSAEDKPRAKRGRPKKEAAQKPAVKEEVREPQKPAAVQEAAPAPVPERSC